MILRRGEIVEMGATEKVFGNPLHPYTKMLHRVGPAAPQEVERGRGAPRMDGSAPEHCRYHEMYPEAPPDGGASGAGARPLAEVEEDHFVGCVRPTSTGPADTVAGGQPARSARADPGRLRVRNCAR